MPGVCSHHTRRLTQVSVILVTAETKKCEAEVIKGGVISTFGMQDLEVD